jgi:CobQ-like glutamine amidotransferase family enzyme
MSIYGDVGNIIAIQKVCKLSGIELIYQQHTSGQKLPQTNDLIFMGGGQDNEQVVIANEFLDIINSLESQLNQGLPFLAICGAYQLLGSEFVTGSGDIIKGANYLPIYTKSPNDSVKDRCIGNIVTECLIKELKGVKIVGFENHGGQTYFQNEKDARAFGEVKIGKGNNSSGNLEGCVKNNVIGSYLHGSLLPKNPILTKYLIEKAFLFKQEEAPKIIISQYSTLARDAIIKN